jgi:hypothetical protein
VPARSPVLKAKSRRIWSLDGAVAEPALDGPAWVRSPAALPANVRLMRPSRRRTGFGIRAVNDDIRPAGRHPGGEALLLARGLRSRNCGRREL